MVAIPDANQALWMAAPSTRRLTRLAAAKFIGAPAISPDYSRWQELWCPGRPSGCAHCRIRQARCTLVSLVSSLAVLVWVLMKYTGLGFDIRAVGANPRAAAFAGVLIAEYTIEGLMRRNVPIDSPISQDRS